MGAGWGGVRLVVFHYHDRPGGVRQVITRGLPLLLARMEKVEEVVLLLGEQTDAPWMEELAGLLFGVKMRAVVEGKFGYWSAGDGNPGAAAEGVLMEVLSGKDTVCWAHNLSVGRNIPLLRMLPEACARAGARLWLHHHDWWWDGRWARWADWVELGVSDLEEALALTVPAGPEVTHFCINLTDCRWLEGRAGAVVRWVGNPLPDLVRPEADEVARAAAWLREKSSGRKVWLAPVRALRRKNPAEALLLARSQEEAVCVVTTGGASSAAEVPAWEKLCQAARAGGWPLVPGVLSGSGREGPSVAALMMAADAIVMPSLQEGFGLPYLEAAALGRPLVARDLPDLRENLAELGCVVAGAYGSVMVPADCFDRTGEERRVAAGWERLERRLPVELRGWWKGLGMGEGTDFGGLTLEGQLEVLGSGWKLDGLVAAEVPVWENEGRVDRWVDRMLGEETDGQNVRPPVGGLVEEVRRRFEYWASHPLLWP